MPATVETAENPIRADYIARLARNFSVWGSALVTDLSPDEIVELVKKLDVSAERLHVDNGVLRRNPDLKEAKPCAATREQLLGNAEFACNFCGYSAFTHRSKNDPVRIQSGGAS